MKDCIGPVADALGDDVPFERARRAAEGKVKHDDAQLVVSELCDGLDSCDGVEVASSIG